MKKIILTTLAIFAIGFANAQESKGYIGLSLGASFPSGDLKNSNASTGINLGLINAGYRFTETIGVTLNWGSTAYNCAYYDSGYAYEYTYGIGYLAIGPMFSFPLTNKIGLDLKPQIALTTGISDDGVYRLQSNSATGFLLGSSVNYPISRHWGLAINLDYLTTKFDELDGEPIEENYKASAFNTSLGIQYKF